MAGRSVMHLPPGLYRGRVEGVESGSCEARLVVCRVPGGCLAVDYEAVGAAGLQHAEHTIVAPGFLYVAQSEAPGVTIFSETIAGVFDAPPSGPYRRRLVLDWDGEVLVWAWHWASAGDDLREQSRALVRLSS